MTEPTDHDTLRLTDAERAAIQDSSGAPGRLCRAHFEAVERIVAERVADLRGRLAAVEALADECADSGCIHLNTLWGRLRAALGGDQ